MHDGPKTKSAVFIVRIFSVNHLRDCLALKVTIIICHPYYARLLIDFRFMPTIIQISWTFSRCDLSVGMPLAGGVTESTRLYSKRIGADSVRSSCGLDASRLDYCNFVPWSQPCVSWVSCTGAYTGYTISCTFPWHW